jgi:hypothetical protein
LEDSLVNRFDTYMYDSNITKTVENIKKLWLSYFLVDLNAATIDKDPRHDLTRRYENLLFTFTSDNLELIETDSVCLKIALENYKQSNKTDKDKMDYLTIAWVNYESYTDKSEIIDRWRKLYACYDYIYKLTEKNRIDENNYSYLIWFNQYLIRNKIDTREKFLQIITKVYTHWYKVLFKIK